MEIKNSVTSLNAATGEITVREITEDDLKFHSKLKKEHELLAEQQEQVESDKKSAMEKLAKLGLTESEIYAILNLK